jgi:hypothetical protein
MHYSKKNLINKYQNKYILDFSTVLHPDQHSTDLDRHGRDCIVIGITTTYAIGAHHTNVFESRWGEVHSIHHYGVTFVRDLRHVSSFPRVLRFPPPVKLKATI